MSDILIRGMEMPKACHECPFLYVTSICDGSKDCPLVPVPPHGRLIEADALRELYEEWENDKEAGIDIDKCHVPIPVIRQNIDDAPTIIPAEEGEI